MGVIEFPRRSYCSLAELPQRGSIAKTAFGTGWWELDEILKFYLGQFIVCTGIAGHGKSTLWLNILAKLAIGQGIKSFLYVPENEANLKSKMRLLWPGTDGQFKHFCSGQCIVQTSVPSEGYDEAAHTIDWVLNQAADAVRREKVEMVLIDPWNELERAKRPDEMMSDYVAESIRLMKQFCRTLDVVFIIIAHPTKAINERGGRMPGLADIESSMAWFNKCDNGLIVHRDSERNATKVVSAKVREIGAGKLGTCHFTVDPLTGIFTPQYGASFEGPDRSERTPF